MQNSKPPTHEFTGTVGRVPFGGYDIPRRFIWHDRQYEIRYIGGHWCRRGRWWDGEGDRRFFRVITTAGMAMDLCQDESTGRWSVAAVHD